MLRAVIVRRIAPVIVAMTAGCSEPPPGALEAAAGVRAELQTYALQAETLDDAVALLAWRVPTASCPHAYRVQSSVDPPLLHEAASISTLTMAPDESSAELGPGPASPGTVLGMDVYYRGLRAERRGLIREAYASAEFLGPAAPTAACMARTWDPVEDAFALGWPRLPGRLTAVDDVWTGLRVEGKCNRSACVDPKSGGGGPDNHHRACVTMSWQETLVGVYAVGGQRLALVRSHWDDGHVGEGIAADRDTLVSIDHGRPVWSTTTVNHRFPELTIDNTFAPVVRTWVLESADTCPGSLAQLGFERRPDDVADVTEVLAKLADIDALREHERRTTRMHDPDADPFEAAPGPAIGAPPPVP